MFGRKKRPVYVLGAGPAGLLAAHAASRSGYQDITIYSKPDISGKVSKSDLFGCQYLHRRIPDVALSIEGQPVRYSLDGPADGYRRKVYGDNYTGSTSVDEYGPAEDHYAWDLREAYDRLWELYRGIMRPMVFGPATVKVAANDGAYVLSTIPRPALCRDMENHKFASQQVWAMGTTGLYNAQLRALPFTAPNMSVVCNGWRDTAWYRAATVFGYSTLEWPGGTKPPISGVAAVSKPLSTDCTCWQGVKHLGRYGTWTKGVLVHTAYEETLRVLR